MTYSKEKVYFSAHFDKDGGLVSIESPAGTEVTVRSEEEVQKQPLKIINGLDTVLIISKPNGSPCCIKIGGKYYCWCTM